MFSSEPKIGSPVGMRRGKYPRIGEIVEEFADRAKKSPGTFEEFGDAQKEALVRSESNIDLFLNQHAFQVDMDQSRIAAVYAFDTKTSQHTKFTGKLFCDATGHGTLGALAQAEWTMAEKGRMGMSNMWAWDEGDKSVEYPKTPWALDLNMSDFPYPVDHHGQWFWESGFDKDAIGDAEGIRDWNLRAVFGAFIAMKNRDGADKHKTAFLTWVAFIGGPRESRQLLGDLVLTQEDIAIGLVVLAIAAISLPIVARSNVYCSHLCPHGAVQQLLPRKWKQKKPMPRSLTRLLLWIRPALIAWVVLVSMMQLPFSLVDIEPFDAYAWRSAAWPTFCVAVIGIIASLRVPMAYCRCGCGTGAILQYLRRHSRSDRWTRADGFTLVCLGLGLFLYLVF